MKTAFAVLFGSALLCAAVWAADKPSATTKSAPKVNKMTGKMASMVVKPDVASGAKMKGHYMQSAGKMDPAQILVPPGLKKVDAGQKPAKMNKIDDRSSKMMLKAPVARKMKDEAPKYSDRIQAMAAGVK